MKVAIFLTLLLSVAFADIWTNCGSSSDDLTIDTVSITPDPPKIGQTLTIVATGSLSTTVTGGSAFVSIIYDGFLPVLNNTFALCTLANQIGVKCPLAQGPVGFKVSQAIPAVAPSGSYGGKIVATDQNGKEIACISLSFNMSAAKKVHREAIKVINKF